MSGRKHILVVDDEPQILDVLKQALETALQAVHDRIYDAAILDFSLPDMNGLTVHREIRQMDEELARNTLFTSGHAQSDQNLGYYSTYGGGFLSKPLNLDEVIDSLESMWEVDEPY